MRYLFILLITFTLSCISVAEPPKHPQHQETRAVMVKVECSDGRKGGGSGVILSPYEILSAEHVNKEGCDVSVRRASEDDWRRVSVKETDEDRDLMLLLVEDPYLAMARLPIKEPKLGTPVYTLGFPSMLLDPENRYLSVSHGHVNTLNVEGHHRVDANIWFGSSGGPAFDYDGNLVGITVGGHMHADYNYIVPAKAIIDFLEGDQSSE